MSAVPFEQWKSAEKLNRIISTSECTYVILLIKTGSFDVEKDLKNTLHITKKTFILVY